MTRNDINQFLESLEGEKVVEIKSVFGNFEAPRKLSFKSSMRTYDVDIEVIYENAKHFYVIEKNVTDAQIPELVAKWILLSSKAKKASGKSFVIVDEKSFEKCNSIINDKLLDIEVIQL